MGHDVEKEAAVHASLRFVHSGAIVGLGSGSTATDEWRTSIREPLGGCQVPDKCPLFFGGFESRQES